MHEAARLTTGCCSAVLESALVFKRHPSRGPCHFPFFLCVELLAGSSRPRAVVVTVCTSSGSCMLTRLHVPPASSLFTQVSEVRQVCDDNGSVKLFRKFVLFKGACSHMREDFVVVVSPSCGHSEHFRTLSELLCLV